MRKLILIFIVAVFASCTTDDIYKQEGRPFVENSKSYSTYSSITSENLIVITLDGVAWDDVYGVENVLDTTYLMERGLLMGDRRKGNKVNIANPYVISYPGYAEIFTGNTTDISSNRKIEATNKTVLEYINEQSGYEGYNVISVSRGEFPYYLFRPSQSKLPILTPEYISIFDTINNNRITYETQWVYNNIDDSELNDMYSLRRHFNSLLLEALFMYPRIEPFGDPTIENYREGGELLTYLIGKKILKELQPKVMYLQFVMTDHHAHRDEREDYLAAARNVGFYIKDLVEFLENDLQYSNNTTIIITTDHGRSRDFRDHGSESFIVVLNSNIRKGFDNSNRQYYNSQLAQTMANILGLEYVAEHEIANAIQL